MRRPWHKEVSEFGEIAKSRIPCWPECVSDAYWYAGGEKAGRCACEFGAGQKVGPEAVSLEALCMPVPLTVQACMGSAGNWMETWKRGPRARDTATWWGWDIGNSSDGDEKEPAVCEGWGKTGKSGYLTSQGKEVTQEVMGHQEPLRGPGGAACGTQRGSLRSECLESMPTQGDQREGAWEVRK